MLKTYLDDLVTWNSLQSLELLSPGKTSVTQTLFFPLLGVQC